MQDFASLPSRGMLTLEKDLRAGLLRLDVAQLGEFCEFFELDGVGLSNGKKQIVDEVMLSVWG